MEGPTSTRSSFTFLEPGAATQTHIGASPPLSDSLEEITSRGEELIERYGADEPQDPPHKPEIFSGASLPPAPTIDANLVTWDGPNDPNNPQNWSNSRKWVITMVAIVMTVNV